jgi:predicted negative regulator of RcsB-dependent stress response
MTTARQRLVAAISFGVIVAVGWFAYSPGLGGAFLLDDVSNLSGLRTVDDTISALNFMFSGTAGPLGRPLALATFLPQADAWGQSAAPFLTVNILIHLANACVLAFVLYRLSIASQVRESSALIAAAASAAAWLLMPLLASSSLMIVQRMTTLSALFGLLGLAAYLWARQSIHQSPGRALTGMSISLAAGTTLAVLSKENGALLPTFVLVMESTILTRPSSIKLSRWRAWTAIFLWLPTLFILAYLLLRVPYSPALILRRDFTAWERLLTESRILWEYLFNAFVPQPGRFGPFHDGYPVARTIMDPLTLLAFSSWLTTLTLAVLWRRRFPLFSFAVLWYLGGHLLESTLVALELYFEHRNYLPIIGPVYALCMFAVRMQTPKKRLVYAGISAYILITAAVLVGQTSVWGNPPMAARYWQEHSPQSVRAATTVVTHQLAQDGPQRALQSISRIVENNPAAGYLKIQELNLSCIISPQGDHRHIVTELHRLLGAVDFSYSAGTMLSDLITTVTRVDCRGVDGDTVKELAGTLAGNRHYRNDVAYRQLHQQLLARLSRHEGDFDQTLRHLEKAIEYKPSSNLNMMMVTTFADAKDFDGARTYIENARRNHPSNPLQRFVWQNQLDELGKYIDELEKHYASETVLN